MLDQLSETCSAAIKLSYHLAQPLDLSLDVDAQLVELLDRSKLVHANESFYALFEYVSPSLMSESSYQSLVDYIADFSGSVDGRFFKSLLISAIRTGFNVASSPSIPFDLQASSYVMHLEGKLDQGALKGFDVVINQAKLGSPYSNDILQLSKDVLAQPSEHFFDYLTACLSDVLAADLIFAARIYEGDFNVISGLYNAQLQHGLTESLLGSPFEALKEGFHYHPHKIKDHYSECLWLQDYNVDSYLSVPLLGQDDSYLGFICIMHSSDIEQLEFARTLLSVFSARAGAELELRELAEAATQRHERYQILIEKSHNGMFVLDVEPPMPLNLGAEEQVQYLTDNARFSECNPSFIRQQGLLNEADLIGKRLIDIEQAYDVASQLENFVANRYVLDESMNQLSVTGETAWLSSTFTGQVINNNLTQIYGISSDVSDRVQQTELLAYQASHDELTQLPNRSYFKKAVDSAIQQLKVDENIALFILDLDGFKEINDTLGHLTGDDLLAMVGPRLTNILDEHDVLLSRLGGDEFGLLLKGTGTESDLMDVAILIMSAIKTPFTVKELDLRIGGSVGISYYPEHGSDFTSLMRCADVAMYRAKDLSKDFEIYQPEDDHFSVRRLSLMMDMRNAVEDGQLVLYYQPITNISDRSIKGFEALVRWNHPEHGLIPPGEFIPLIELTDMIEPLTWWVIETAINQLRLWQELGKDYIISVNVSTRNINDDSFVYRLSRLLRAYKVDARCLEIEITESTLMSDPIKGRSVLNAMAAMGVRFAVDDYGTGYSSLAYLKSLPINTLKIDRAFIANMLEDEQDQIIVKSTIQLAHNLGMQVTAEGIEDPRLIAELKNLGCDYGQGFFICRPVPYDDLADWIKLYGRGQHPISKVN